MPFQQAECVVYMPFLLQDEVDIDDCVGCGSVGRLSQNANCVDVRYGVAVDCYLCLMAVDVDVLRVVAGADIAFLLPAIVVDVDIYCLLDVCIPSAPNGCLPSFHGFCLP